MIFNIDLIPYVPDVPDKVPAVGQTDRNKAEYKIENNGY